MLIQTKVEIMYLENHKLVFFIIICILLVSVTNAGGTGSKGNILKWGEDEKLNILKEPFIGNSDYSSGNSVDENLIPLVDRFNFDYVRTQKKIREAEWNYEITRNRKILSQLSALKKSFENVTIEAQESLVLLNIKDKKITDSQLKDQILRINHLIRSTYPSEMRDKIDNILFEAINVRKKCGFEDIKLILQNSNSESFLEEHWLYLANEVGGRIKPLFEEYLTWLYQVANHRGFYSVRHFLQYKECMTSYYEGTTRTRLILQYIPLRSRLYDFLRKRLFQYLRGWNYPTGEAIPIYFIDRIHAKTEMLVPFQGVQDTIRQSIQNNSLKLDWIKLANSYYKSLGFDGLTSEDIKNHSVQLKKSTTNKKNLTVWNFFNNEYRLVWSSSDAEDDMRNIFQGVGMIYHILELQYLPPVLQDWPNEIFKEAIVGAATLSIFSPSYLVKMKIVNTTNMVSNGLNVNRQFKQILYTFNTLSVGMVTDLVTQHFQHFHGNQRNLTGYEKIWWEELYNHLGIENMNDRNLIFSAGTIENIMDGMKYEKEFISEILKYQFFQQLCIVAGKFDPKNPRQTPLYKCDISGSKEAGKLLRNVMKQGNSVSWNKIISLMTANNKLEMDPLFNYYHPMYKWLKEEVNDTVIKRLGDKFLGALSFAY